MQVMRSGENLRLHALALTCSSNSALGIASVQRGHLLYVPLASHSVSKCSVRPAISTTCVGHTAWWCNIPGKSNVVFLVQVGPTFPRTNVKRYSRTGQR